MREAGWAGKYGFYEAADYTGARPGEGPKLVKSYMAHHQGMALAALANALTDDAISRCFENIPEARALSLLLEEKPSARVKLRRRRETLSPEATRRAEDRVSRAGRAENRLVDAHLLFGAGATALFTARGCALFAREGMLANRCFGDLLDPRGALRLRPTRRAAGTRRISSTAARASTPEARITKAPSTAWTLRSPPRFRLRMARFFSRRACITARRRRGKWRLTLAFPVALCSRDDCWAHPAFQVFSFPPRARRRARSCLRADRAGRGAVPTRSSRWRGRGSDMGDGSRAL